jgi:aminoglycoside phosphotransferase (APT) family kinase protein
VSARPDAAADSPPSGARITIVFPVAGKDSDRDFRGFETADGETLIHRSLRSFRPFLSLIDKIVYIVLEEHEARFDIARRIAEAIPDVPFEIVRLASPTAGPAETVARGVAKSGLGGNAIVCDIDHRLDPAPLFRSIAAGPDCVVSLWPLAGEDLKRWSIACVARDGAIAEVSERRLPDGAGRFSGVIGCYYFADIHAVMDRCLERGFKRFSEYFNDLAARGEPARGVAIETAEFFGDAERIRQLERAQARASGTIFCDIDGTLIVHEDTPDYSRPPQLLPGSREKLRGWIAEGYHVVLCTARPERDEPRLVAMLGELNIPYHRIVTGLPSGMRVLINDRRPYEMFTAQAASLEIARDQGIAALEITAKRRSSVLRRFEGGSFAETLLIEEDGKTFVRKRAAKDRNPGYHRLRDQFRTLERFAQLNPGLVPALHGEENNSHEYFYDMEFLDRHMQLAECDSGAQAAALDRLMDRFETDLYCHRTANAGVTEDWFLRHLQSKIDPKMAAMSAHERLRPLLFGEGVDINGRWYPTLDQLLGEIRRKDILPNFLPQFLSLVHGDLTFQNIMVNAGGDTKVIDMEAQDSLEAVELDLGKIFQSIHSQYETWSRQRTPLCESVSPANLRINFRTADPDGELLDAVSRRWSKILNCSRDAVAMKGQFYLGLHLVRMVPFRLKTSVDHAVYALATAIMHLDAAVETASSRVASGSIERRIRAAA